ncbi:MAG: hypothetical protein AAF502_25105 [Bacteroidota bacterium]
MTNDKSVQLIEQYLVGALSAKDSINVELLILTDEAFGKLFNNMKSALNLISYQGRADLFKKMKSWETSLSKVAMKENNIHEKIEHYLVGKLSVDEILEFEKKLDNNPEFRQQFEETKRLFEGIKYTNRKKLRKRLQRVEADMDAEEPQKGVVRSLNSKKILSYAAGLALLMALTFIITMNISTTQNNTSVIAALGTYPSDLIQRSPVIDNEISERLKDLFPNHDSEQVYMAFLAYEEGDYSKAKAAYESLLTDQQSSVITFFKGQAAFGALQYEDAISAFDEYLSSGEQRYADPSVYWKGLSLIASGNEEGTKALWSEFATEDCHFCEKAAAILETLK